MKKFFNSTWFRCITVLMVIAVTLSGLLAVLNDLLYVSPEVRTLRAIKKIYGEEKEYSTVLDVDNGYDRITYQEFGHINKIYIIGDDQSSEYQILFQTTGTNGYKGGTITVWTQVQVTSGRYDIKKVLLEGYEKQTLMSKLGGEFYSKFELNDITALYEQGKYFAPEPDDSIILNPVSNATYSANAGCNAVNCVIKYLGGNA